MIKLDISVALFLYLFGTVIVVFALWIWLGKRPESGAFGARRESVWQCSVCSYVYTDTKNEDFSRCPRCKSINTKQKQAMAS
ncbi:MAG: hypothetical protein A2Z72_00120 [Omnitrophica bacterium RBG_13_46_9]|nr:MAG: hypothetical protein A2Z72_00120 [Omnitrophica bacterium RBG_13_46_9]